jgi:L-lysine 6-transaminase
MAEFVKAFERHAMPPNLPYLFMIDGGALAVENALKAAFDWKVRKNFKKGLKEEKGHQVIHFKQAFHGRSGYTLSLTNTADPRKIKYFPKFSWPRITNPKITFPMNEENLAKVEALERQAVQEIKDAIHTHGDDIAAMIIEPIQGEGGDNHFRPEFFRQLRTLADENEIMLIYDEVQTGVGLTGKMWCHQHFGVEPDMMSFGKKTQVCGFLCGRRIDEVEENVFHEASRINSTWGGNLMDMVRFHKYLEIIVNENLVENARTLGEYFLGELKKLEAEFVGGVSQVRGRGFMVAFDLPDEKIRTELLNTLFRNGLIALSCGQCSVRFRPALNITRDVIDEAMTIVRKSLKQVLSGGKKSSAGEQDAQKFEY